MKIYKQEVLDGLSEHIQADTTVAYCVPAIVCEPHSHSSEYLDKIKASANPKQIDLYYIKSILVLISELIKK